MVIYFVVLYMRYQAGIVTDEMLAIPKSRFIIIGFLEALGVVSGMYSAGTRHYNFWHFSLTSASILNVVYL